MDKERQALLEEAKQAIVSCDAGKAEEAARKALEAGLEPYTVITEGFVAGIIQVGDLFDRGVLFLPELMLTAKAMKAGTEVCLARVPVLERIAPKKVVIGTVEGDVHDIGKSIVVCMLLANGFEVHDLGISVPAERFVAKAIEVKSDVVGISTLLTTTMTRQKDVIKELKKAGLGDTVKTIVGGAPTSQAWADRIGAHAYGGNAVEAVLKIRQLTGSA